MRYSCLYCYKPAVGKSGRSERARAPEILMDNSSSSRRLAGQQNHGRAPAALLEAFPSYHTLLLIEVVCPKGQHVRCALNYCSSRSFNCCWHSGPTNHCGAFSGIYVYRWYLAKSLFPPRASLQEDRQNKMAGSTKRDQRKKSRVSKTTKRSPAGKKKSRQTKISRGQKSAKRFSEKSATGMGAESGVLVSCMAVVVSP